MTHLNMILMHNTLATTLTLHTNSVKHYTICTFRHAFTLAHNWAQPCSCTHFIVKLHILYNERKGYIIFPIIRYKQVHDGYVILPMLIWKEKAELVKVVPKNFNYLWKWMLTHWATMSTIPVSRNRKDCLTGCGQGLNQWSQ